MKDAGACWLLCNSGGGTEFIPSMLLKKFTQICIFYFEQASLLNTQQFYANTKLWYGIILFNKKGY